MDIVAVNLGSNSYNIYVDDDYSKLGPVITGLAGISKKVAIVSNDWVDGLYGAVVRDTFLSGGFSVETVCISEGEEHKSLDTAQYLYDRFIEWELDRKSLVVALGGGVIGDLTGFVSATFMRGLPLLQLPTTLLAQVDSSIGGKVAVNHPCGKNMIGSFYQPCVVFTALNVLNTLSEVEIRNGMAEIVKYGMIKDENLFHYLEDNCDSILSLEREKVANVILRCCQIKVRVTEADEKEEGLRAILNYGHTIGHALEVVTNYEGYRHGETVAIGMSAAVRIAHRMSLVTGEVVSAQDRVLSAAGLPVNCPGVSIKDILASLKHDKKVRGGKVHFVLPRRIGEVFVSDAVNLDVVEEVLQELGEKNSLTR